MNRITRALIALQAFLFIVALVAAVAVMTARRAKADEVVLPDVKVMMGRVEAILVMKGYAAHGYARTAAPTLTIVDSLPGGDWGAFIPGDVRLSRAQPAACLMVSLAHELAHDATVKMLLIDPGVRLTAREVQERFEGIADLVETHVSSDGVWLPNCVLRRSAQ